MTADTDELPQLDEKELAWRALLQSHSALIALLGKELEAEAGLPLSQYEVLVYLSAAPEGRLRMNDLARSLLLSKSGVTRLVDRMGATGLVERAACEGDRRVTYAAITPAGELALRAAAPVHMRGIDEHFSRYLDEDEARVVASALLKIFRHAASDLSASPNPATPAVDEG
jgi:DNA-binding MarR family transcriptional regulator